MSTNSDLTDWDYYVLDSFFEDRSGGVAKDLLGFLKIPHYSNEHRADTKPLLKTLLKITALPA